MSTETLTPSTGTNTAADAINALTGLSGAQPVLAVREQRRVAVEQAQRSYAVLLLDPAEDSLAGFSLPERYAVAWFNALLHQDALASAFYRQGLVEQGAPTTWFAAIESLAQQALQARATGPWGHYPAGPLSTENEAGPELVLEKAQAEALQAALGQRLLAALVHTHLLVQHPRDAAAQDLQKLLNAGWTTHGIVTLSQLVAFLAFQVRVAHGLRVVAQTA